MLVATISVSTVTCIQGGPEKWACLYLQWLWPLPLPANVHNFWHIIHCRKFATGEYIVSPQPHNMVCVTTLPCKILTTTFSALNFIHCCKKSSFYFGGNKLIIANFCQMIFKWIVPDEYYLFSGDEYSLPAGWSLLWQQTLVSSNSDSSGHLCSNKFFMTMDNISRFLTRIVSIRI